MVIPYLPHATMLGRVTNKPVLLPTVTPLSWDLWPSVFTGPHPGFAVCEPFTRQTSCQMGDSGTSLLAAQSFVPLSTSIALLTMAEYCCPVFLSVLDMSL